jgi:hypothetical protein
MTNPFEFSFSLLCGLLIGLAVFLLIRAAKHLLLGDTETAKNYFRGGLATGLFSLLLIYICNMIFP